MRNECVLFFSENRAHFYVKMKGYDVMKKIFISQPMRDKTKDEILREREKVAKAFSKYYGEDVEILESYFKDYDPKNGCIPLKYLSKSLELLADADIIYFCPGWDTARGCKIEHQCAVEYGIERIYE